MSIFHRWGLLLVVCVQVGASLVTRPSMACGGTFCDGGPQAQPVDQTGENILFVAHGDGTLSAHVQIQYSGDPMRFAWIVPLPSAPEVSIGSQPLFDNLLLGSVPTYQVTRQGCGRIAAAEGGGGVGDEVEASAGPTVLSHQTVGSFDVTVLSGGTATELVQWLMDNGYEDIPDAPLLFEHYTELGLVFAAIKLVAGAGLDAIHPIEFRYAGTRPAIPLILTSVAAVEDMAVRVFVLGEERFVPTNYQHVELNPVRLDWIQFGSNYVDVVARAVDSDGADGHAFVTEYAGTSSAVSTAGLYDSRWNAEAFLTADALTVPALLESYGLLSCSAATCTGTHPQVLPLLREHLPAPTGVDEGAFYDCIGCYATEATPIPFDGVAFARGFLDRIVVPGRDAQQQLLAHPYLTRMLTLLSPEEMTVDPAFHPHPGAPDVAPLRGATWQLACASPAGAFTVESWEVALTEDATWPTFDRDMPYALRIETFFEDGLHDAFVDNTDAIGAWLNDWNASRGWPPAPAEPADAPPLVFGGESDPSLEDTDTEGAADADGAVSSDAGGNAEADAETEEGGRDGDTLNEKAAAGGGACRASAPQTSRSALHGLLALCLVAAVRRRRGPRLRPHDGP